MIVGSSRKTKESECLCCYKKLNGACSVGSNAKPRPGNISICIYCGHIMAYGKELRLRELTDKEMYDVAGMKEIIQIQKARKYLEHESINNRQ